MVRRGNPTGSRRPPSISRRALFPFQPDVYLLFSELTVLVEAKRYDSAEMQCSKQLAAEYAAWAASDENDCDAPCIVLAIGGLKRLRRSKTLIRGNPATPRPPQFCPSLSKFSRYRMVGYTNGVDSFARILHTHGALLAQHCRGPYCGTGLTQYSSALLVDPFWRRETKSCRPISDASLGLFRELGVKSRAGLWLNDLSSPARIRTSSIELFSKWRA